MSLLAIHGGGIFGSPERFERTYRASVDRSSARRASPGQYAAKISEQEASDILEGRLPDGSEIPVFSFDEFKLWHRGFTVALWCYF